MKDTGITRRIDELGRIVIPRELRKILRIKDGDPLEFYSNKDEIIIKKYSPIAAISLNAQVVADGINELTEKPCIVVDKDQVVYATGNKLKELIGSGISAELERAIDEKKSLVLSKADGGSVIPVVKGDNLNAENQIIIPVMSNGDAFGGVILFDTERENRFNCTDVKFVGLGATFLAKQFEE
ncbi:MAG: AbrB/MazE/SpoVT family DNA-binding domain-containing protein [Clostridia bacterium]|nr:AbrB/MazE/SpoVT family DNA-binding domain-containing protein [Clostridia bacterium]